MRTDSFIHAAPDGVEVFVHRFAPEDAPRALVVIAHGMGEHGGRYARLAEKLTERGYLVLAPDHRGHGRTAKTRADLGHFGDSGTFQAIAQDVRQIAQGARREYPLLKLLLLGHSMGSYAAQTLVVAHPQEFDAIALSGTTLGGGPVPLAGRQVAKLERLRTGKRGRSSVLRELTFGQFNRSFEGRTPFDWLTRDTREVDAYIADPLCGAPTSNQSWIDVMKALSEMGKLDWSRLSPGFPIYLFWGSRDPVTDFGKGPRRLAAAMQTSGLTQVSEHEYPDARHETLNETNRDEVASDLLAWIERVLG
jgi:alpha-beta hydrolase superfamily lysophospholipase